MRGVFHGIGLIDPRLKTVGFGIYHASASDNAPAFQTVAALNILQDLSATPQYPVTWPAAGTSISLTSYDTHEGPDARSQCNYTGQAGQPIFLILGPGNLTGSVTAALTLNGTAVPCCAITDGTSTLSNRGAVALLPQNPLANGNYTASITVGTQPYTWSFVVGPATNIYPANTLCYGVPYNIQNGYNNWGGGYLDVCGVVPRGFLDPSVRESGGNLFAVSTASSTQRDALSGSWEIQSANPRAIGPVQYNDIIYLQSHYDRPAWFQVGGVIQYLRGGYLDTRDPVGALDPGPGNLFRVSTAMSAQRDGFSGTWKILSAATTPKTGPVLVNDPIYLQNQYNGGGSDPNALGGYLETRGAVAASDPGTGNLYRVLTVTKDQFDRGSGTWQFGMSAQLTSPLSSAS
jgi:hypothetical protein